MNEIKYKMPLYAVNDYLEYRRKCDEDAELISVYISESLSVLSAGMKTNDRISILDEHKKIWGELKTDNRTAEEITDYTMKRHGLRIRGGEQAV